jgi:hypothetical protein
MENLTNKIINYKKSKNAKSFNEIYKILQSVLKDKVKFIYYTKWYPLNLYIKCKYCQQCINNKELQNKPKEIERRKLCDKCVDCICSKGYFNLNYGHLCDYEDVKQELDLEILKLINDFDIKLGDFNSYLFSSLWDWRPSFITLEFVENITHNSLFEINEEGEEQILNIKDDKSQKKITSNLKIEEILKECKTETERKVCKLLLDTPTLSQKTLAKKLGTYQRDISRIINKLRKRLKKFV